MSFIWPVMLYTLLIVPLFVALYWRMQQRRRALKEKYGAMGFVQQSGGEQPGWRRHLPPALFLVALSLLLMALARPEAVVSLPRVEGVVMLAFDVSGSMAAEDLEPTRLEAAKAAARGFIDRQPPGILIGVVAFSDSGFTVQAPTDDREVIYTTIERLAPERGTALATGILSSLNAIAAGEADEAQEPSLYSNLDPQPTPIPTPFPPGEYASAVILLLTDGENNEPPDPYGAAQAAAERGVRVHTIGIGTAAGVNLEVEGFTVFTRLNEALLQDVSNVSGGQYFNAENEEELEAIYAELDPELVVKPDEMEVTSLFAGASIILMLVGGAFSLAWFSRLP